MADRELIVKTLAAIEDHPEHHHQEAWVCDSGMCFAGWAGAIAGWRYRLDDYCGGINRWQQVAYCYRPPGAGRHRDICTEDYEALLDLDTSFLDTPDGTRSQRARHVCQPDCDVECDGLSYEWLFDPENTLDDLYRLCAFALGETEQELRDAVEKQRDYDPVPDLFVEATTDPEEPVPFQVVAEVNVDA